MQLQGVLDDKTSAICMARSGFAWDLDGNPLPETDTNEPFPGPPPYHPNCRSTLVPVVKGLDDLIEDPKVAARVRKAVQALPESTQASMDGKVASSLTYEDWLKRKNETFQQEVLGPGKYKLWKAGRIDLRDLIDQQGNPLTVAQLRGL